MSGAALMASKLMDVSNRVVLITGGSRGIGAMMAEAFVVNGATVYVSSRKAEACEETANKLSALPATMGNGGRCVALPADISNDAACVKLVQTIEKQEGRLDVLINNAGAAWGEPLETHGSAAFDKIMQLNVRAVFRLTQLCLPLLQAAATPERPATIINVGSINGIGVSILETYSYAASKAALHHLTRVLAAKLADKHITVNALAPGPFPTKMLAPTLKDTRDLILDAVPLHRLGKPSDVAGISLLLASPSGSYITGTVIPIDGGILVKPSL